MNLTQMTTITPKSNVLRMNNKKKTKKTETKQPTIITTIKYKIAFNCNNLIRRYGIVPHESNYP